MARVSVEGGWWIFLGSWLGGLLLPPVVVVGLAAWMRERKLASRLLLSIAGGVAATFAACTAPMWILEEAALSSFGSWRVQAQGLALRLLPAFVAAIFAASILLVVHAWRRRRRS